VPVPPGNGPAQSLTVIFVYGIEDKIVGVEETI
jgi:hypothetical protein